MAIHNRGGNRPPLVMRFSRPPSQPYQTPKLQKVWLKELPQIRVWNPNLCLGFQNHLKWFRTVPACFRKSMIFRTFSYNSLWRWIHFPIQMKHTKIHTMTFVVQFMNKLLLWDSSEYNFLVNTSLNKTNKSWNLEIIFKRKKCMGKNIIIIIISWELYFTKVHY